MVETELEAILSESTSEVLETMCFTGVLGKADSADCSVERVAVGLTYRGHLAGRFGIRASLITGRNLAGSFLGTDEEHVSKEQASLVLCELANMICGAVLNRLAAEARFELSHPEVQPAGGMETWDQTATTLLQLECGAIEVGINLGRS